MIAQREFWKGEANRSPVPVGPTGDNTNFITGYRTYLTEVRA
jgi:hypothetical protein